MSLVYRAAADADPASAWELIARPRRWHEWAPHVRGAWGLGDPEIEAGRSGFVRLAGVLPVPVRVTAKHPGRSWTWQAGPLTIAHRVFPTEGGCMVEMELSSLAPVERALALSYGSLVALLTRNLARVASA